MRLQPRLRVNPLTRQLLGAVWPQTTAPDDQNNDKIHFYIPACEVKWALESITTNKASGSDGIPVELFQILKDDAVTKLPDLVDVDSEPPISHGALGESTLIRFWNLPE